MNRINQEIAVQRLSKRHPNLDFTNFLFEGSNSPKQVEVICKIHGLYILKRYKHLVNDHQICKKCKGINASLRNRKTSEQFIIDAKRVHGDKFNYDLVEYKNNYTNVLVGCKFHVPFKVTPANHLSAKSGCPSCKYAKQTLRMMGMSA